MHIDIGTGDGAFVYRTARATPSHLVIGVDANAANLAERSRRAAAKPARGGAPNALFVHAPVEQLPVELHALADQVTVILPWGSLLRGVMAPEPSVLDQLRALCRPGGRLEVVVSYAPGRDPAELAGWLEAGSLARLPASYRAAGFEVAICECSATEVADRYPTRWARRLAFDPSRRCYRVEGAAL